MKLLARVRCPDSDPVSVFKNEDGSYTVRVGIENPERIEAVYELAGWLAGWVDPNAKDD